MTLQETLQQLKSQISGDSKKDIDHIFQVLAEARGTDFYFELEKETEKILNDIIAKADKKDKQALIAYIKAKSRTPLDEKLDKIQKCVYAKKLEDALKYIDELDKEVSISIQNVKKETKNPIIAFRYYRNEFEETLCNKWFPEKNIFYLTVNYPEILENKSQILFVLKRFNEAYETAKKIFEYNPISVNACITLAGVALQQRNIYSFSSIMEKAKEFTYSVFDFFNYNFLLSNYYSLIEGDKRTSIDIQRYFNNQKTPVQIITNLPKGLKQQLLNKNFLLDLSDIVKDTFLTLIKKESSKDTINKHSIAYQRFNEFYSEQDIDNMLLKNELTNNLSTNTRHI